MSRRKQNALLVVLAMVCLLAGLAVVAPDDALEESSVTPPPEFADLLRAGNDPFPARTPQPEATEGAAEGR